MQFDRVQDVVDELDKYDFSYILNDCIEEGITDIYVLSNVLSKEFGPEVEELIDEMDINDFVDYLSDRYNIRFREKITHSAYLYSGNKVRKIRNNNTD